MNGAHIIKDTISMMFLLSFLHFNVQVKTFQVCWKKKAIKKAPIKFEFAEETKEAKSNEGLER